MKRRDERTIENLVDFGSKNKREEYLKAAKRQKAIDAFNGKVSPTGFDLINQLIKRYNVPDVQWKDFKIEPVVQPKTYFYLGLVIGLNFGLLVAALLLVMGR